MASGITKAQFEALKRKATRLQRENPSLSRSSALDQIANREGFRNWSLLSRARLLEPDKTSRSAEANKPHLVTMRGVVRSREPGVMPKSWEEAVPAKHPARHYAKFKWITKNFEVIGSGESGVRERLATMRRAIGFMDATGFTPSRAWSRVFGRSISRPEGFDHTCVWMDAEKRYVVTTEPYLGRGDAVSKIAAWCAENDWRIASAANGLGMWNPCRPGCPADCTAHTRLLMLTREAQLDLRAVVAAIS